LTFKAGMIAFGETRSGVGMEPVRKNHSQSMSAGRPRL
jgi:hypothetical protein